MTRFFNRQVSSEADDPRLAEAVCFRAATCLLVFGFVAIGRHAETMQTVLLGALGTCGVALQLVMTGHILRLRPRWRAG